MADEIKPYQTWDNRGRKNSLTPLEPMKSTRNQTVYNNPSFKSTSQTTFQNGVMHQVASNVLTPQKMGILAGTGLLAIVSVAAVISTTVLYSNQVTTTSQADYLESCISKACIESKHLSCLNQTCQCDSTHYKWDSTYKKCIEALSSSTGGASHGDYCVSGVTTCGSKATCIESICKCDTSTQYWDGSSCQTKKTYLTSCTVRSKSNTSCLSDNECYECSNSSNLICNTTTLMCVCPTNYYYDSNSMKCLQPNTYFQYCNSSITCDSTKGLSCKTTTSNATDGCLTAVNQCDCSSGYYFDYLAQTCLKKKPYQRGCQTSCECDDSKGLKCYDNTCICTTNMYYNNVTLSCVSNGFTSKLNYLDACTMTSQCNGQLGLSCNSTTKQCNCPYPFYWSSVIGSCVECPDGWVILTHANTNVSRCYYFSNSYYLYWDALWRCTNAMATLYISNDVNEYTAIYNYRLAFPNDYFWIGLRYDYWNGNYFWLNGQVYTSGLVYTPPLTFVSSSYVYYTYYIGSSANMVYNYPRINSYRVLCEKIL